MIKNVLYIVIMAAQIFSVQQDLNVDQKKPTKVRVQMERQ